MPLVVLAFVLFIPLALIALVPLSIVLRYRASTARRQARGWVAAINVAAFGMSAVLFLAVAAVTSVWMPRAFTYTVAGLAGGCVLGLLGLWLSRWEATAQTLHYTPSRLLVLTLMLVVVSRMAFGLWRAWYVWRSMPGQTYWLVASGAAGSLAAGAVVLGYFLAYHAGVWVRSRLHRRATATARR
jgi:hypothetical protein